MYAINCKSIETIKMFLEEVSADMSIIEYNLREEVNCSEEKKKIYLSMINRLSHDIYSIAKKIN